MSYPLSHIFIAAALPACLQNLPNNYVFRFYAFIFLIFHGYGVESQENIREGNPMDCAHIQDSISTKFKENKIPYGDSMVASIGWSVGLSLSATRFILMVLWTQND